MAEWFFWFSEIRVNWRIGTGCKEKNQLETWRPKTHWEFKNPYESVVESLDKDSERLSCQQAVAESVDWRHPGCRRTAIGFIKSRMAAISRGHHHHYDHNIAKLPKRVLLS